MNFLKISRFEILNLYSRAIYFGAYDTAKEMFENPGIGMRFAIAQVWSLPNVFMNKALLLFLLSMSEIHASRHMAECLFAQYLKSKDDTQLFNL